MAEHSLLRALSDHEDDDREDNYKPRTMIRLTRKAGRKSQGADMPTPEHPAIKLQLKRPTRSNSNSPTLLKREKIAEPVAEIPKAPEILSSTQPIRPAASAEGIITSSANDKNIEDTMARMQLHLDDKEAFAGMGARIRRSIVKGLKSSFGNRYNGRCTEIEKKEYIARWVQLAGVHNELLTSAVEKESLSIKIDPKLLKSHPEIIVLD